MTDTLAQREYRIVHRPKAQQFTLVYDLSKRYYEDTIEVDELVKGDD